jgi:hypothetical protein
MKLGELVQILNGKLAQGNPEFVVTGVNSSALAGQQCGCGASARRAG